MANEKRLIYANALIGAIDEYMKVAYDCPLSEAEDFRKKASSYKVACFVEGLYEATELIEEAPTVDAVEVVHGRWIDDGGLDEDGNGQYRCSSCGVGEKHNPTVTVSYCWNCGAKMNGGNENVE